MSEELNHSKIPDFDAISALHQRLSTPRNNGSFDPHNLMVKRRQQIDDKLSGMSPVIQWPEEDIKKLEEFCSQHGIVGFNTGRLPPLVALSLLKAKLGMVDERRFPEVKKQILYG